MKMLFNKNMARPKPWTVLSRSLFATAGIAFAASAQAQPIESNPSSGLTKSTIHQPSSYCHGSTLSGAAFLQFIRTIMAHGDLADISFVEKTLGTKFSSHDGMSDSNTPDPKILLLDSDNVLDSRIGVHMSIYYRKSDQLRFGEIAGLGFDDPSTFITDCFHFSPDDISSHLRKKFFAKVFGPGSTTRLYSEEDSSQGRNGSRITLEFFYDIEKSAVVAIIIRQFQ